MAEVVDKLAAVHPDFASTDVDLLQRAFDETRFIYLRRGDAVAQAVSLLRAEQTNVWFETAQAAVKEPVQEPRFDLDELRARVRLVRDHNAAWQEWFTSTGTQPYSMLYEELDTDPVGVTRGVLDFLGLEVSVSTEILVRHRRLADHLNAQWINRYRAEGCT